MHCAVLDINFEPVLGKKRNIKYSYVFEIRSWEVLVTFILTSWIYLVLTSDTLRRHFSAVCPLSPYFNIFLVKYIFRVIDLHFFWQRNVHITQIFCEINPKNKLLERNDAMFLFLSTELSMKDGEYQMTEKNRTFFISVFSFQQQFQLLFSL